MAGPILLFDSGVGGLSVLAHVRAALPQASLVYCADNAGFPYGTKSEAELGVRIPALLGRLVERFRPCAVVIACNTASTIALAAVRSVLEVPVVGTVPAIKPAAEASSSRVIGVLGTLATIRQPYVDKLVRDHAADCTVLRHGSPELVELAERKLRGDAAPLAAYRACLEGLVKQPDADRMDVVVLACTHFPLVRDELAAAALRPLQWVDSGAGIARRTAVVTQGMAFKPSDGDVAVFTRDDPAVDALRPALHSFGLSTVQFL